MKTYLIKIIALGAVCSRTAILAADPTLPSSVNQDFPQPLTFELGDRAFAPGDSITISGLRGTKDTAEVGSKVCVTGTYTLASEDEADLSFFATTTNRISTSVAPEQMVHIKKGTGSFCLSKEMTEAGYLHVSFYSHTTGQATGGIYFGQGQWVLHRKFLENQHEHAAPADNVKPPEPTLLTGPNQVLLDYLGNPVTTPSNLDTAYTKDGLTGTLQSAAQNAGITLAKLEIDDSEFPCLVGIIFSEKGDKAKFVAQLRKLPAYEVSGGVDSEISYAMNLVPQRVFPPDDALPIYHRMMLREAVLSDRINGGR